MRRPSTFSELHRWWMQSLRGEAPQRHEGEPRCGLYKRRLTKGGPWVPVRIFMEQDIDPETGELASDEVMRIEVEGIDAGDPAEHWTYLTPISSKQFEHLVDYRLRDSRMMDARQRIDLADQPTLPQGVF